MANGRSRALGVAAVLFERHGYDGVTIADVARAAGLARRTLYAQFGSKAGLLAAIADAFCEEFALALTRQAGGGAECGRIPAGSGSRSTPADDSAPSLASA